MPFAASETDRSRSTTRRCRPDPADPALAQARWQREDDVAPRQAHKFPEGSMRWLRRCVLACVVASLPACITWKEIPVPEPPAPPNVVTDVSRIRLQNGQSAEFLTLVVATDSLFGIRNNIARTRMTVSFDQVQRIEVRKKDPARTLGLLGLVALGAYYSGITGFKPQ